MFPCPSNKKPSNLSAAVCNRPVFACWRLKNVLENLFKIIIFFYYKGLCSCLCRERELLVPVDQWQCLYPGALLSQGEEDRKFWGRGTETLDIYWKVSEQCIQTALQKHTVTSRWLKWSKPGPANSCPTWWALLLLQLSQTLCRWALFWVAGWAISFHETTGRLNVQVFWNTMETRRC